MSDPRFDRSVIALCMHDANGAFGIGFGQVREGIRFRELLEEVGVEPGCAPDCEVHHGGPVEPGRGFVLHSADWDGPGTIAVEPLGALSASLDVLKAIAAGTGPSRWLFALGYAGWAPGQLEGEMRRHGWYAAAGRPQVLFDTAAASRWSATWARRGRRSGAARQHHRPRLSRSRPGRVFVGCGPDIRLGLAAPESLLGALIASAMSLRHRPNPDSLLGALITSAMSLRHQPTPESLLGALIASAMSLRHQPTPPPDHP